MFAVRLDDPDTCVAAALLLGCAAARAAVPGAPGIPCGLRELTRITCPLCGLTTSVTEVARLHVGAAFAANPAGLLLVVLAAGGGWSSGRPCSTWRSRPCGSGSRSASVRTRSDTADLLTLVIGIAYFSILIGGPRGQTVGKQVLGIRVVDHTTGGSIGYARDALRYFASLLSWIVCFLGYLWMLGTVRSRCWHDRIASTYVVPVRYYPVS